MEILIGALIASLIVNVLLAAGVASQSASLANYAEHCRTMFLAMDNYRCAMNITAENSRTMLAQLREVAPPTLKKEQAEA